MGSDLRVQKQRKTIIEKVVDIRVDETGRGLDPGGLVGGAPSVRPVDRGGAGGVASRPSGGGP